MKTAITELFGIQHPIIQGGMHYRQMDAGAWSYGLVVGPIHDIPTVKQLIDRIISEAEHIIRRRLTGLLDGTVDTKPTRAAA